MDLSIDRYRRWRRLLFGVLKRVACLLLGLVLMAAGLEIWFRIFGLPDKTIQTRVRVPHATQRQKFLGMHNTQGIVRVYQNLCGEEVTRSPAPHPFLLKTSTRTEGTRVLFLGDSFTEATQVSTGSAYYDVFEQLAGTNWIVFAAGRSGFGSLQERMLLDEVAPLVKPDMVVWQLTGNDVRDNVFEFDRVSLLRGAKWPKPYLDPETGEIQIRDPSGGWMRRSYLRRFLHRQLRAAHMAGRAQFMESIDLMRALKGRQLEICEKQGLQVFESCLQQAMETYPDTRFVGFCSQAEFAEEFRKIFQRWGTDYLDGFHEAMQQVDNINCPPRDFHWNHLGHQVAGKVIFERLLPILDKDITVIETQTVTPAPVEVERVRTPFLWRETESLSVPVR